MNWLYIVLGIIAIGIFAYLLVALLNPEIFE